MISSSSSSSQWQVTDTPITPLPLPSIYFLHAPALAFFAQALAPLSYTSLSGFFLGHSLSSSYSWFSWMFTSIRVRSRSPPSSPLPPCLHIFPSPPPPPHLTPPCMCLVCPWCFLSLSLRSPLSSSSPSWSTCSSSFEHTQLLHDRAHQILLRFALQHHLHDICAMAIWRRNQMLDDIMD